MMKLIPITAMAAVCSLLVPLTSEAQNTEAADRDALDEVVVISTRVVRDGYESATPTSILGSGEIDANAPRNIADFVGQLPSMAGNDNPTVTTGSVSAGRAGINSLNLRALGGNRVLVLLDGRRVSPSLTTGIVDLNTFPQELIQRVEVVTGGASAAWGSDAVAGVVNFALDREFTGLKASIEGNSTDLGDNQGYNFKLTGGFRFADDRGHLILSTEIADSDGIKGNPRDWYRGNKTLFNPAYTPTNGEPELIVRNNSGYSVGTPGLILTDGPLAGTYFGPGGTPAQLNTGSLVRDPGFVGGDWAYADFGRSGDLDSAIARQSAFALVSYDVSDDIQIFAEASYVTSDISSEAVAQFNLGNITIFEDNAFLPPELAAILQADTTTTSYSAGSLNADLPPLTALNKRTMTRIVLGANGSIGDSDANWTWDAHVSSSSADISNSALTTITNNYQQALDAVRDGSGQIVCRVNADADPLNDDPTCVPYNILGEGTASDPAKDYVLGTNWREETLEQDVIAVTVQGDPFSNWAGPISMAVGVEHRKEKSSGTNDPLTDTSRAYFAGNYRATVGSYDVTDIFVDTVVPLITDKLDMNAAVRQTDYSTAGSVTTWKAGVTWTPIEDITVRAYASRDIRGPNLSELFAPGGAGTSTLSNPFTGNQDVIITVTSGNTELVPEEADSMGIGFVFRPQFLPGFTASADFYDIDIAGAIGAFNAPTIVNGCFDGITSFCDSIVFDSAMNISEVNVKRFNANSQTARGVDLEASYQMDLYDGNLTLRLMATHFLENATDFLNPLATDVDTVGENRFRGPPDWKYRASAAYDKGASTFSLSARGITDGVYNNSYIECSSGCPTSSSSARTIDSNGIAGAFYLDGSWSYEMNDNSTFFIAVQNMLDKDPAAVPASQNIGNTPKGVNIVLYDLFGRVFRAGVRFQFD